MYLHHSCPECDDFTRCYSGHLQITEVNRLRQENFLDSPPSLAACCIGQEKIANLFFMLIVFKPDQ